MNAHLTGLTGMPLGVDPLQWRRKAEARLEQLHDAMLAIIAALDATDGDTDLEPSICGGFGPGHVPITDDREGGDVLDEGEPHDWDDEHGADDEPSLGWVDLTAAALTSGWSHRAAGYGPDHDD